MFFLGGGIDVSKSRNKYASFFEIEKDLVNNFGVRIAGRYEDFGNDSSFDPKLSVKYIFSDNLTIRATKSSSFSMPSMAQMFASDINLGSVRDFNDTSPFVRQAQIGNPNLKPATSINNNLGCQDGWVRAKTGGGRSTRARARHGWARDYGACRDPSSLPAHAYPAAYLSHFE